MLIEAIQCCNKFLKLAESFVECSRKKAPQLKIKLIEELK
jgi:hypothetical protein